MSHIGHDDVREPVPLWPQLAGGVLGRLAAVALVLALLSAVWSSIGPVLASILSPVALANAMFRVSAEILLIAGPLILIGIVFSGMLNGHGPNGFSAIEAVSRFVLLPLQLMIVAFQLIFRLAVAVLTALAGWLMGGLRGLGDVRFAGGVGAGPGGPGRERPVRIWTIRGVGYDGNPFAFELRGEPGALGIAEGDAIRVEGRYRFGVFRPRRVWNLTTNSDVRWSGRPLW